MRIIKLGFAVLAMLILGAGSAYALNVKKRINAPGHPPKVWAIAGEFCSIKDWHPAIADCQETLARNPDHFGAASGQGLCHLSLNEFREAAVCFRRALEIHPHLDAVRHNLALAQAEGGGSGYLN